jgi:putative DNA primase/helicase
VLDPSAAACPVHAVAADIGLGKTRSWRQRVAAVLVAAGRTPVLAVPRHRLGDEIVRDLAEAGIVGRVYRGREAADPDTPGETMCRELDRAELITGALAPVSSRACKHRDRECQHYTSCGYQRQREQQPDVWVIPHQLLFRAKPGFIPKPDAIGIDESFWSAALHGVDRHVTLWLRALLGDRNVPRDPASTADLIEISRTVHNALNVERPGRLRRAALRAAGILAGDLRLALRLEWRRKIEIEDVFPGMPLAMVRAICNRVAEHNQEVARLARFWELLIRTAEAPDERSPWLELRTNEPLLRGGGTEIAIRMAWRDDIHDDWRGPTIVMDATMPAEIVRQFFPDVEEPWRVSAPMPHVRVRQITDRPMTADMLIPTEGASERTNATRRANVERVRRFIEVRANDVAPGRVLVICQLGLEAALVAGELPRNVEIEHFNNVTGENAWSGVALVIVVGRTEPAPHTVERTARALFGTEITEIAPDDQGAIRYPMAKRGIRMRAGYGVAVQGPMHPDPRAEAVRWAICEAGLVQAIGRGRGVNRSADDPLQIDILTSVVLPIEVDEVTTWERIQPSLAEVMRARGAVPLGYADMAAAHPDLFSTAGAAEQALRRGKPLQTPIEEYLIRDSQIRRC